MDSAHSTRIGVAVVGSGITGSHCAYRLAQTRPGEVVGLYEASDRPGGRLLSRRFRASAIRLEMGGMFVSDAHEITMGLLEQFGLRLERVNWTNRHQFLRGHFLTGDMYSNPAAVPYQLGPAEAGKQPGELVLHALMLIVPDLLNMWPFTKTGPLGTPVAAARHLRALRVKGRPLWDWGFWNLLEELIGGEAIALIEATHGSVAAFRNINAYDAIFTLSWEAHPGQNHYVVADGFEQLPRALIQAGAATVRFQPRKQLVRVEVIAEGFRLYFKTPAGEERVEARAVILALPKRAIELIELDPALAGDRFREDLAAVQSVPACKMFLLFDRPWWNGSSPGTVRSPVDPLMVSSTDLPLQQVYYFTGTADGPGVLMTAFADDIAATYWPGLAGKNYIDTCPRDWLVDDDDTLRVSEALIDAVHRQLQLMHPGETVDRPKGAVFIDWSAAPSGGGWHTWMPYARSWEVCDRIRQPTPPLAFHICGEAFARPQGWVEGALSSAEVTLRKHFGVPRPWWVRADYDFET